MWQNYPAHSQHASLSAPALALAPASEFRNLSKMHFKCPVKDRFEPTGQMILHAISANEAYANYLLVEPVYDIMLAAAHQTTLKLYGGPCGVSVLRDSLGAQPAPAHGER